MKHLPLVIFTAVFGLALLAAPAAHAFTIEDQSNTNSNTNSSTRYGDPDARFSGSGNGQTTIQQGNTTLRFGGQQGTFDQRYNPNRMFDPNGRPDDSR